MTLRVLPLVAALGLVGCATEPLELQRKMCAEEIMEQEHQFLDLLNRVERWDVSNIDQLRLWPGEGAALRLWPELE